MIGGEDAGHGRRAQGDERGAQRRREAAPTETGRQGIRAEANPGRRHGRAQPGAENRRRAPPRGAGEHLVDAGRVGEALHERVVAGGDAHGLAEARRLHRLGHRLAVCSRVCARARMRAWCMSVCGERNLAAT